MSVIPSLPLQLEWYIYQLKETVLGKVICSSMLVFLYSWTSLNYLMPQAIIVFGIFFSLSCYN